MALTRKMVKDECHVVVTSKQHVVCPTSTFICFYVLSHDSHHTISPSPYICVPPHLHFHLSFSLSLSLSLCVNYSHNKQQQASAIRQKGFTQAVPFPENSSVPLTLVRHQSRIPSWFWFCSNLSIVNLHTCCSFVLCFWLNGSTMDLYITICMNFLWHGSVHSVLVLLIIIN